LNPSKKGLPKGSLLFFGSTFFAIIGLSCGEIEMADYLDILPLLQDYDAIGMKPKHICSLLPGISESAMSRAKNGSENLPAQDFANVRNLLSECKELARRNVLPVSWTDLRAVRLQLDVLRNEKKNPPGQPSEQDLDIFRRFVADEDLSEIAIRHRVDKAEILRRIELINSRAEFISRKALIES
jgi:hypothetical protein